MKTAVVIGATGLVGQTLTEKLALEGGWGLVLAIHRASVTWKNPKVRSLLFDYKNWDDLELQIKSFGGTSKLDFFCCLGTTISKAKSKENFRLVDYEYVIKFARLATACKASQLFIISSVGVGSNYSSFYLQVKSEMEADVKKIYPGYLHFMRPGLLLGHRNEFRFGERLAVILAPLYSWFFVGDLSKYKPIAASIVAWSMVLIAGRKAKASEIVYGPDMLKITQRSRT